MNFVKRLVIFYEYFPPAYQSGGITRSISNLSLFLCQFIEVYVFTSNRDLKSKKELGVITDTWLKYESNLFVFYSKSGNSRRKYIRIELERIKPDIIYINGLFTPAFSFFPLLLKEKLSKEIKWVIAPRGMLQQGTLAVKPIKKRIYLNTMKVLKLFEGLIWHATEKQEKEDIVKFGIDKKAIRIASNIPAIVEPPQIHLPKKRNEIRLVFLALISPVKNLDFLVDILSEMPSTISVTLDIFGPIKDPNYWKQCLTSIESLPSHIKVNYKGQIKPEESHQVLISYHAMSLLTKGENFGHSIFESLYAGTPVLISDKTPWRNLSQKQAGWDMGLDNSQEIREKLIEIAAWGEEEYLPWRKGARDFAIKFIKETDFESQYFNLFEINN